MRIRNRAAALHFLVWAIFIAYEVLFLYFTSGVLAPVYYFVTFYALNMGLFYFTAHVTLDHAFIRTTRPVRMAIILVLLELPCYILIKDLVDTLVLAPFNWRNFQLNLNRMYLVTNLWRGIYFIGLSIAYWSLLHFIHFLRKSHRLETDKLRKAAENLELENRYIKVENAYLHNQISPHLLFNSLNFIFNKVRDLSDDAGEGVLLLSDLMRYSMATDEDDRIVDLAEEVEQVTNLITLSKLRYEGKFYLRLVRKGRISGIKIIPLILITLVENMVKHGDLEERKDPGVISMVYQAGTLTFKTYNKIRKSSPYRTGGLGLANIKKRLTNHYGENYDLVIDNTNDTFTLTLNIYDPNLLPR